MYFGKEQEKQVLKYLQTRDENLYHREVHKLLKNIAYGVAAKMKMKPASLYQSRAVKDGCVSLMWEKLTSTWDPNKGRAYSYLTAIAQNYYCSVWRAYHKKVKTLYKTGQEIDRIYHAAHNPSLNSNVRGQIGSIEEFIIKEEAEKERFDTALQVAEEVRNRQKDGYLGAHGVNDASVAEAVMYILENADDVVIFNKKAIYLYMRELTGLSTKQIVHVLTKMRKRYDNRKISQNNFPIFKKNRY